MILLDTHVLIWALQAPELLSQPARDAIESATRWSVASTSLYEIQYKHMIGKWPEIAPIATPDLADRLKDLGFEIRPATGTVMDLAGRMDWTHRDPFDRIIVATGAVGAVPLVSKDSTLDTAPLSDFHRIW